MVVADDNGVMNPRADLPSVPSVAEALSLPRSAALAI